MELEAPKEDQGVRDSKLESVVTCRKSGFSVGMYTRIQGPGTSESSVGSACLWKWGSDKRSRVRKVQDQVRVRAGRGLGITQRLWVENPPNVG